MSPRKKVSTTKKEIIQVAMGMFLENGFTNTTVKSIADALNISTGNLTFHYPTKEHLLSVLVELLCEFQWHIMEVAQDEGNSSLMAWCLELPAMAAICEENKVAKDFYLSAYTHTMTLDIIRKNDVQKAKQVFGKWCQGWEEKNFIEAETLVSGIEYATLMTTPCSASLRERIAGALNTVLGIYGVPADIRREKILQVLDMEYRSIGRRVLNEFIDYVSQASEEQLEQLLRGE